MTSSFLSELEPLSRDKRIERVVALGQRANNDDGALRLLLQLSQSMVTYDRWMGTLGLGLTACDSEWIRLMKDSDETIAALAISPAAKRLPDAAIQLLFDELPLRRLDMFCCRLTKEGRGPALMDAYLQKGKPILKKSPSRVVFSWASEAFMRTLPQATMRLLTTREWRHLAKRCPTIAADAIRNELVEAEGNQASISRMKKRTKTFLLKLCGCNPTMGMQLLTDIFASDVVDEECVRKYARIRPVEVSELVMKHKKEVELSGKNFMRRLNVDLLMRLFDVGVFGHKILHFVFFDVKWKVRKALYAQYRDKLAETSGELPANIIEGIPSADREREALKALDSVEEDDEYSRIEYLAFVPFPLAQELGKEYLKNPEVDLRSSMCESVVGSGRFFPVHLGNILDFCLARCNECDPVRGKMLHRLSKLPVTRWRQEEQHFEKLALFLEKARNARDASKWSIDCAVSLVLKTARVTTTLVDRCLGSLVERFGLNENLEHYTLPIASINRIWHSLLPWLAKQRENCDNHHKLTGALCNFGSRLRFVRHSSIPFIRTLCDSPNAQLASFGATTLFEYFRPEAIQTIPELLRASPDWMTVNPLRNAVSGTLQGRLLDPYLTPMRMKGLFLKSDSPKLLVFMNGHHWTAARQLKYAKSIVSYLSSADLEDADQRPMLSALVGLTSIDTMDTLGNFIRPTYKNELLRDLTIETLGKLNDSASMHALLEALDDSRARVAIYALRRRLRGHPSSEVVPLLRAAAHSKKVTVQKEAVRLISECGDDVAYNFLRELANEGPLHEDVHIAWVRAMWTFAHKPEVWSSLNEAAMSERDALAMSITSFVEDDLLEDWQRQAFGQLTALLLARDNWRLRRVVVERLGRNPLSFHEPQVVARLVEFLNDDEEIKPENTINALINALIISRTDPTEVARYFFQVKNDLLLQVIIRCIGSKLFSHTERAENIAVSLLGLLMQSGRQPKLMCQLIALLPLEGLEKRITAVLERGLFHPGAVLEVAKGIKRRRDVNEYDRIKEYAVIEELEKRLRGHGNACMRFVGLAVLCYLAKNKNWKSDEIATLEKYRKDQDPWVRDEALLVDTE